MLRACESFLRENYLALHELLSYHKTAFEQGLSKIPKHENSLVPDMFRRKSLLFFAKLLPRSEDEEFEIVQQSQSLNWISDEELDKEEAVTLDDDDGDY